MAALDELAERARRVGAGLTGDVPSPCISVCRMDAATGRCEGCLRTLDEIAVWSSLHDQGRLEIWRLIEQRLRCRQAETCAASQSAGSARSGPP
jgi:predicted Fe-S protein YdhL (DUF1289 family)